MQRRAFLITGLAAGLSTTVRAAGAAQEGFTGVDRAGQVVQFERQTAVFRRQVIANGYAGEWILYELVRPKSPVRFPAAAIPGFAVQPPSGADPVKRYGLFRLETVGRTRRFVTGQGLAQGVGTRDLRERHRVALAASPYGGGYVRLDPAAPLLPGEYALTVAETLGTKMYARGGIPGTHQAVYAFGVD
ncbi:MAG TPA: hypothetical protein VEA44_14130 [Caulobacter sp.]|nr:hypothetical protein [Caulobacter sp.]